MKPFSLWSAKNHGDFLSGLLLGMRCQTQYDVSKEYKVLTNPIIVGDVNESGVYLSVSDVDMINSIINVRVWVVLNDYIDQINIEISTTNVDVISIEKEECDINYSLNGDHIIVNADIQDYIEYKVIATIKVLVKGNSSITVVDAPFGYKDSKVLDFVVDKKDWLIYKMSGIPEYGREIFALGSSGIYNGYAYIPIWTSSKSTKNWRAVIELPLNVEYRGVITQDGSNVVITNINDTLTINISNNNTGVVTAGILIIKVLECSNKVIKIKSVIDVDALKNIDGSYGYIYVTGINNIKYGLGGLNIDRDLKEVYTNDASYVRFAGYIWSCTDQLVDIYLIQSVKSVIKLRPGWNKIDIAIPFLTHKVNTSGTAGDIWVSVKDTIYIDKSFLISIINRKNIEQNNNLDGLFDVINYSEFILFEKKFSGNGDFEVVDEISFNDMYEFYVRSSGTSAVDAFGNIDFIEIEKIKI